MNIFIKTYLTFCIVLFFLCCNTTDKNHKKTKSVVVVEVQPFTDIDKSLSESVFKNIQTFFPNAILNKTIDIPPQAYYRPRNRYKADSILRFFNSIVKDNHVILGLTSKDISTKKDKIDDFGVMGLGNCPGKSCVASSFRLDYKNKKEQLFKVAIHELGHTQGLPHCDKKTCFMRDAKGKNPTNEEVEFCLKCKTVLKDKGVQI